ncbi:pentatricopeptide repeat-containing protein At2g20540 [Mercurialis annua]|uniref:pentatricopeptide repeat-containing protein At2g20540 n=1 Tax=Mercurialis annua TaxID=3986 RepID=UPI00215E1149|nr:pentatricopeptide repeat-containing protein At2g20540 [Mercurialis annua]
MLSSLHSLMATGVGSLKIREIENFFVPILQNCKNIAELKKTHALIIKYSLSKSNYLVTKMVDVCDKNEDMNYASSLFKGATDPSSFLYNAMIRAYTHNSMYRFSINVYKQMLRQNQNFQTLILPDEFTFPFVVKSCARLVQQNLGKQVHGHYWKFGKKFHLITENALVDMYVKCDNLLDAHKMFDEMTERDAISWNGIISGHVRLGQMRQARGLFDAMPNRTIVSWTSMISGYARIGSYMDALDVFREMQNAGVEPDEASIVSVLPACAKLGALETGKWIHMYCARNGLLRRTCICNALIEMYTKCGCIDQACQLFDQMLERDVISWSTMIGGLANHGKVHEAIAIFERMKQTNIKPNGITFVGLLSACAHAGFWKKGLMYFYTMIKDFHIDPEIEHYGSLVDLLGRAGKLNQALDVVATMPMKPDSKIWGCLLSSCRTYSNMEVAVIAMERLEELEPDDTGNYVLLSNIYADLGKWEGVSRMWKLIRSKKMKKTPGCSSIELNNVVQEFVSGDVSKPYSKEIFWLLELLAFNQDITKHLIEIMPEDY